MYPEIQTDRFELKQILASDQDFIFLGLSDPAVIQYYGVSYRGFEEAASQMKFYESISREKTGAWWKIVDRHTQLRVGACGMNFYNAIHRKAEVGYWLLPPFWKKGIITEVVPVMIRHLFNHWDLHRIEAVIEEGNETSCRVVEKLGFTYEGRMREAEAKNGRWINLLIYGLLSSDQLM